MARAPATVLICGFGLFGDLHAKAWRLVDPETTLLVADPSAQARERALRAGVAPDDIATAPDALLGRADLVDIVAPPAFHLPLALKAIEAGKPVMIEKPAVRSVEEARVLMRAATATPVQVGLVLRAHPLVETARAMLDEGAIGELLAMEGDFSGWKRMRADSSLVENDGVHFLDLMRLFAGARAKSTSARAWRLLDRAVVDDLTIELAYENDIRGRLRLGVLSAGGVEDAFVAGALTTKTLRLMGKKGNILIDFNRNRLVHAGVQYERSEGGFAVTPTGTTTHSVLGATPEALLARSFRLFLDALINSGPVMCGLREGAFELATTMAAIEACLAQAAPFSMTEIEGDLS